MRTVSTRIVCSLPKRFKALKTNQLNITRLMLFIPFRGVELTIYRYKSSDMSYDEQHAPLGYCLLLTSYRQSQ